MKIRSLKRKLKMAGRVRTSFQIYHLRMANGDWRVLLKAKCEKVRKRKWRNAAVRDRLQKHKLAEISGNIAKDCQDDDSVTSEDLVRWYYSKFSYLELSVLNNTKFEIHECVLLFFYYRYNDHKVVV